MCIKSITLQMSTFVSLHKPNALERMETRSMRARRKVAEEAKATIGTNVIPQLSTVKWLTSEERALDGAPQGQVFNIVLLDSDQLTPIDGELSAKDVLYEFVIPTLLRSTANISWNVEFDAITLLRRLIFFHHDTSLTLPSLIPGIEKLVRSRRSILARNALFLCSDIFGLCSSELASCHTNCLGALTAALLDSCTGTLPRTIRVAAQDALDKAMSLPQRSLQCSLVSTFASRVSSQSTDIVEAAMTRTRRVIEGMNGDYSGIDFNVILPALNASLNGKSSSAKSSTRAICGLMKANLGNDQYLEMISCVYNPSSKQARDLMEATHSIDMSTEKGSLPAARKEYSSCAALKRKEMIQAMRNKKKSPFQQQDAFISWGTSE